MMRKFFQVFLFYTLLFPLYANDFYYTIKEKTIPTMHVFYQSPLYPGDKIKPTFGKVYLSKTFEIDYYKEYPNLIARVDSEAIYIDGSDKFDNSLLYKKNTQGFIDFQTGWMPTYYLDALSIGKEDLILESEPFVIKMKENDSFSWERLDHYSPTLIYFNEMAIFIQSSWFHEYSVFYVTKIENINDTYYRMTVIPNIVVGGENNNIKDNRLDNNFVDGEKYTLYMHHKNNRLRIYIDGHKTPLWELMYVNKEFTEIIKRLPNNGFPKDQYYKSYLANDIFEPWPVTLLSEIKKQFENVTASEIKRPESPTYKVLENLRLRSKSDIAAEIVATLQTGTLIYFLKIGESVTLDGITAPWVYVETEDGKRGWCFSGYLATYPEEPVSSITNIPVNTDNPPERNPNIIKNTSNKTNTSIPIILLPIGGAILVISLSIFFLIKIRKK